MTEELDPQLLSTVVLLTRDLMLGSSIQAGGASGLNLRKVSTVEQCLKLVGAENAIAVIVDLSVGSESVTEIVAAIPPAILSRSIAFGPHVHEARLQHAREVGFGTVVSRGQFVSQHPLILKRLTQPEAGN